MKLFELFADLSLNSKGFESGVKNASKQGSSLASSLKNNIGGAATFVSQKVSATTIALGNLMADAVKASAGAAKNLVQNVFEEYANTEQLYGGIETLFKGSAYRVKEYADEAFKTAGMSANEYMEIATGFSAKLLDGLNGNTVEAAELTDMAIQDMADNVNKLSSDMSMVQNAYMGFSRGNFTMLDNLRLGYGGTAEEMARLINDSGVLGESVKVTAETIKDVPFDKIIQGIHIIQEEMGVTGTTAAEAADTISGSFSAFQASWKNLLSGLADEKDMDKLVDNLFESGENLITNLVRLVPRIGKNALEAFDAFLERFDIYNTLKDAYKSDGVMGVIEALKTEIGEELAKIGPIAVDTGADLIAGIYTGLTGATTSKEEVKAFFSDLWSDVVSAKNTVVEAASGLLGEIYAGLTGDSASNASIKGVFTALWNDVSSASNVVVTTASDLLGGIYTGLTGQKATEENIVNTIKGLFTGGVEEMETLKTNASGLLVGISEGLTGDKVSSDNIGILIGSIFNAGFTAMDELKVAAGSLFGSIYEAFSGQKATAENIGETIGGVFSAGVTAANDVLTVGTTFFSSLANNLGDPDKTLLEKVGGVFEAGSTAAANLLDTAGNLLGDLYAALTDDEATATKIRTFFDELFATPEEWKDRFETISQLPEYAEQRREEITVTRSAGDVMKMLSSLVSGGHITESQFDEWSPTISGAIMSGKEDEDYSEIAAAIEDAYNKVMQNQETKKRDELESQTEDPEISGALSSLPDIVAAAQDVITGMSTMKSDTLAAINEGLSNVTVTGTITTGNVMLNTGALVGALTPQLNLRLGILNSMSARG